MIPGPRVLGGAPASASLSQVSARKPRAGRALLRRLSLTAALTRAIPFERRIPFATPERLRAAQERRIAEIAELAVEAVPYYREALRRGGLGSADVRTATDLALIPLVRRESLRRDPERFLSQRADRDDLIAVRTGGSTGEPVTFMRDARSLFIRDLNLRRFTPLVASITGKRFRRRAYLLTTAGGATERVNEAFERRRLISTGRIDQRTFSVFTPPRELIRELDEFRPDVITAFGSYLEELFTEMLATGEGHHHRPALAIFTSDPLSPRLREEAARRLGIRTLGLYQAVETPMIGFECGRGRGFHVNIDLCPIRIVDEEEHDVPMGEPGEVVISNLVNRGTVLLNYALGDRAALEPGPCDCGRTLPRLSLLEGRTSDWLIAADGERVHPQAIRRLVNRHPPLWRYQIVQERPGRVRVRAAVDPAADAAAVARDFHADAEEAVSGLTIALEPVETLERSEGGKARGVIKAEDES